MFANFNFINNKYNQNSNFINNNNYNNNFNNNYSNMRYNNSQANIQISYDNYFTNNYYKEIEKKKYANDLRQQMEENRLRKEKEKKEKEENDLRDELRLLKENQQLELQQKTINENKKNIITINNNSNINNNTIKTNKKTNNNSNIYLQSYLQQRSKEIKTKDNEIKNLLSSINDTFFHQINRMNFEIEKLKEVNLHSNLYKIDLAKSIQDLSNTLHKKNYEQSFKKDSMYKMMIETNKRKLDLQNKLKFEKIPYYNDNNYPYINLSRSISYNVPRTRPLKELGWYY